MIIIILYSIAIAGSALALKSKLVWEECGADCPAISAVTEISATFGWYCGLTIVVIAVFLITWKTFNQH